MASYVNDFPGTVSTATLPDKPSIFTTAFGPPTQVRDYDPYAKNSQDVYDLPRAYQGRNRYLGEVVDQKMKDTPNFWTEILPIQLTDDLTMTLSKWTYDRHVANHQPEHSVSRLTTSSFATEQFTIERMGLAIEMEHGMLKTELGLQIYQARVVQIIYSMLNTLNFDIYRELLSCSKYTIEWNRRYGYFGAQNIVDILERERTRWAIAQKTKFGMEKLQSMINEEMQQYGGTADTWVIDPRILAHLNLARDEKTDYRIAGPQGPARVDNFDSVIPVAYIGRSRVFEAKQVADTDNPDFFSGMMRRERQIGGYMFMIDKSLKNEEAKYSSYHRSIKVYDEDIDGYKVITIDEAIRYSGLFDPETGELRVSTNYNVPDYKNALKRDFLRFDKSTSKAFSPYDNDDGWDNVQIFGQIDEKHMTADILRAVARTLAAGVYDVFKDGAPEVNSILRKGMAAIERIRNSALTLADIRSSLPARADAKIVNNNNAGVGGDLRPPQNVWQTNEFGSFTTDGTLGKINYAGLKSLGEGAGPDIVNMLEVVETIVDHASRVIPGAIAIDARYASSAEAIKSAYSTFLDNIIGTSGFQLWAKQSILNGVNASAGASEESTNLTAIAAAVTNADRAGGNGTLLGNLFGDGGPLAVSGNRYQQALRSAIVGLLASLKYEDAPLKEFIARTGRVESGNFQSVTEYLKDLKKAGAWFAIGKRELLSTVNGIQTSLDAVAALPESAGVSAAFGEVGVPNPDTYYLTPLKLSGRQVLQLVELRNTRGAANAWAKGLTISRPGSDNTAPASAQELAGLANRIRQAQSGSSMYASQLAEMYPHLGINDFARSELSRKMEQPIQGGMGHQRDIGYGMDGRATQRRRLGIGAAMDIGDGMDADEGDGRGSLDAPLYDLAGDVAGYYVTSNLLKQWRNVNNWVQRECERIMARLFLLTPVNRDTLLNMVANNISTAFINFLVFRPFQTYNTALGIYVQRGAGTGRTYMRESDVMLQDDAYHKSHFVHLTFHARAKVTAPENVYIAHDIFVLGTLGGAGTEPFIPGETPYDPAAGVYGGASIFFVALPGSERAVPNPISASGNWMKYDLPGNIDQGHLEAIHYSTYARYVALWGWDVDKDKTVQSVIPIYQKHIGNYDSWGGNGYNTVMWKDLTMHYNPVTGKHDLREENTGHWGPITYENCAQVRRGVLAAWDNAAAIKTA